MRRREGYIQEGGRRRPVVWLDPVAASPTEVAVWSLLLVMLGLVGLVWGAAVLSSWLANGSPARVGVNEAVLAMARFGTNKLQWEGAWSPSTEADLAGPRAFWWAFAAEGLGVGLLFWPAWRLMGPRPSDPLPVTIAKPFVNHPRTERKRARRERVASQRAAAVAPTPDPNGTVLAPTSTRRLDGSGLDRILVDRADGRRLILGRFGSRLVAAEHHRSVIAFGPSGSGKTSALGVPAILEWPGPMVVIAARPDVVTRTWDRRLERGGECWLFEPTGTMKQPPLGPGRRHKIKSYTWSPLLLIASMPRDGSEPEIQWRERQWVLARRTARWMLQSSGAGPEASGPSLAAAEQMLAPMLLAAAAERATIGQVSTWFDTSDDAAITLSLQRIGLADALTAWLGAGDLDPTAVSGSAPVLAAALRPYRETEPGRDSGAHHTQIHTHLLFDGRPNSLYLYAPAQLSDPARAIVGCLATQVIDSVLRQASASASGRLAQPLLVVVDDSVHGMAPELLGELASTGAGMGIQVLSLFTDIGQLVRAHGRERADQVAVGHGARMALPTLADNATLDLLSASITGDVLLDGAEADLHPEAVDSSTWRRLPSAGRSVLAYGGLPPLAPSLRPWYADEGLRALVMASPGGRAPGRIPNRFRRWRQAMAGMRPTDPMGPPTGGSDPLDSRANDRESDRYWQALMQGGTLPHAANPDDTWGRGPAT